MAKLVLSEWNPNTRDNLESHHVEGGIWETRGGRKQTRRFAECFCRQATIPMQEFSLLDVGCALGDAFPVFRKRHALATLYGCDISETAVRRCHAEYGHLASFFRAGIDELTGFWDVIYCSNVLEHFEQHLEAAEILLARCRVLYAMTPFHELRDGSPLCPAPGEYHVATFYRNTFDSLVAQGKASRVVTSIFSCPGAWGLTRRQKVGRLLTSLFSNSVVPAEPLQILYQIENAAIQAVP